MFTITKVLGNSDREWSVLVNDIDMFDENYIVINNPKDILVDDLKKAFYEGIICYKIGTSNVQFQISFKTLLDFIKEIKEIDKAEQLGILTGNEKTIEDFFNIYEDILILTQTSIIALRDKYNSHFLEGETIRDVRYPKLIRYMSIWDFGYQVNNAYVKGVGTENDLYIEDSMIESSPSSLEYSLLYVVDGKISFPTFIGENALLKGMQKRLLKRGSPFIGVIDFRDFGGFEKQIIDQDDITILSSNNKETKVKIKLGQSCFDYYIGDNIEIALYKDQLESGNYYYYKIGESKTFVSDIETIREMQKDIYIENDTLIISEDDTDKLICKMSRTPLLITHGNLHQINEYQVLEDDTIVVTLNHQRIVNLSEDPETESGWLEYPANNEYIGFPVDAMNIVNYLSLGDSVVLYLNERNLSVKREVLQDSGFENYYLHYRVLQGILFHIDGSIANYQIVDYDEKRTLYITNAPQIKNSIMSPIIENPVLLQQENSNSLLSQTTIHYDLYTI